MTTRTQFRATCPACFAQHALRNGRLAEHGYRRPQLWHANVGTCSGAGAPHFGTPEGRDFTRSLAQHARESAESQLVLAERVLVHDSSVTVFETKRVAFGVSREVVVDNPNDYQRHHYAALLRSRYTNLRETAIQLDKQIAKWVPVEPIAVQVAEQKPPVVHFYSERWRGKSCAASVRGAQKGFATRELERVTCEKCKASRAWNA